MKLSDLLKKPESLSEAYEVGTKPKGGGLAWLYNLIMGAEPGGFQTPIGAYNYLEQDKVLQQDGYRDFEEPVLTQFGPAYNSKALELFVQMAKRGLIGEYGKRVVRDTDLDENWKQNNLDWQYRGVPDLGTQIKP